MSKLSPLHIRTLFIVLAVMIVEAVVFQFIYETTEKDRAGRCECPALSCPPTEAEEYEPVDEVVMEEEGGWDSACPPGTLCQPPGLECETLDEQACVESDMCEPVFGPSLCQGDICTTDYVFNGCAAKR